MKIPFVDLKRQNNLFMEELHIPIHKEEAFREFNTECFSNIERFADEILSLPMFPGMTDDELYYVSLMINKFNKKYNA